MAKRVKTTTVKEELEPELQVPSVDMSGDFSNIETILSQFNESALRVEVYKDEMGHMEYCETIRGTTSIDKDTIRDTWGGGKFELRIYSMDTLETTVTFRIAKKPANVNNPSVAPSADINFLQKMVLTLLGSRGNDSGPSFKDMAELVLRMNNPTSPEKTLDVLMKGMELGKGSNASADWKSELIHTVKELGKDIIPTVVEIAASRQPTNGNGHREVVPATSTSILKQGIVLLKQKVIQGLPVGLALDWIVANGADYANLITAMLKTGYEALEELDPDLKNEPYKVWFTNLYEGLKHVYAGNSNDADSDGSTGDVGNTADDGSSGS